MDAVTFILQHLDVDKLLDHYGFDVSWSDGNTIRACCRIHDGNNPTAFVMKVDNGLWYCHTGDCGGGDAFTLVQKMEGMDFPSAVRFLADLLGIDIADMRIKERRAQYIEELKNFIKAMKNRKQIELKPFTIAEEVKQVTKYRNFTPETLEHFQVGYVEKVSLRKKNGKPYSLHNRLAFPIIFHGTQVGISFRRVKKTDYPKWSHQPASIEIKNILYNYDEASANPNIVICEGINDVLAFYEIGVPSVAVFGSHITEEQYRLLLKTGADLTLAFDGDDAGRLAIKRAYKLFQYKANLFSIDLDINEDAESIPREELRRRYDKRRRL